MSKHEKTHERDLRYSAFRRQENVERLVGRTDLDWIDIDACEYCKRCYEPVAFLELTIGDGPKVWSVTQNAARRACVRAYLVRYYFDNGSEAPSRFKVENAKGDVRDMTPKEYLAWLGSLHDDHSAVWHT